MLLHLVVHPERRGLVDGDDHRLADETASEEMLDDVLRHCLQPVVAGDQVVLLAQLPFELRFLLVVEFRLLDES